MNVRNIIVVASIVTLFCLLTMSPAIAEPVKKVEAFVCPVFNPNSAVGDHNPNAINIANGDHSILPGKAGQHGPTVDEVLMVPVHATNGDGTVSPAGAHASPGYTNYSAIWNNEILEP
ncbi:membrane-associated PAP2 superfamily phosphatase [Methanohalophilus levihalophilus]|uniref:hypothetical protein n=1 Tax=Methanohalophilus levihalophilus TaxID=1431282 RepID=UPI001AE3B6CE|nr:hypothetical protein [Methanohalophilus levihalophilus]MBP2031311.1 membrane-associated PAP2 superfamily phosphatase [Methanohalophilus levihalophilus]